MKIQDIAREAGVSTATVSRVFGNHPNVRKDVRDKVLALARQHGYHPRLSAKRRNVVLITPSRIANPIQSYTEMALSEMVRELTAHGYRVEIVPEDNLDFLDGIQFCGAVALLLEGTLAKSWESRFDAPLVMVNIESNKNTGANVISVGSDEGQGMELAIGHLAGQGHVRIGAMLFGSPENERNILRRKGIFAALAKRRLPVDEAIARIANENDYVEVVGKLLREDITALLCTGEKCGIMAAYAIALFGRRIPEELSLVAYELAMTSRYCVPAQTTITQDYATLSAAAVAAIDARLAGHPFPRRTDIPYKLIERDSVARRSL